MAEHEMNGRERFSGEKGKDALGPRNSSCLVDSVLEIFYGIWPPNACSP